MFQGKEYVYEVYKTQSFSKAAANLYISQPSLSATVKKIETRLGTPIFDRSTNPIRLTECGRKYIQHAEQLMDMESEFSNYLSNLDNLQTGRLRIGGSNLFSSYILPPLLSDFMKKYPLIEVKLVEAHTKALEKQLFEGELDLIIDNYCFSDTIFTRHFFCTEHLVVAIPSHFAINKQLVDRQLSASDILKGIHLLDATPAISLDLLGEEPFLLLRSGNDTRERSDQLLKNAQISPTILLKLDQQATAYHIACSGMGVAFISDTLVCQVPPDSRVTYYKLSDPLAERTIYFYHKHNKYMSKTMETFLSLACQTKKH